MDAGSQTQLGPAHRPPPPHVPPQRYDFSKSRLALFLGDAPGPADAIFLHVTEVSFLYIDGRRQVLPLNQTVNLLDMRNGVLARLMFEEVQPGTLSQIRLLIDQATVVIAGKTYPLDIPSGGTTGLKIATSATVSNGALTLISLDWDASANLHQTGNGQWKLQPVIKSEFRLVPLTNSALSDLVFGPPSVGTLAAELLLPNIIDLPLAVRHQVAYLVRRHSAPIQLSQAAAALASYSPASPPSQQETGPADPDPTHICAAAPLVPGPTLDFFSRASLSATVGALVSGSSDPTAAADGVEVLADRFACDPSWAVKTAAVRSLALTRGAGASDAIGRFVDNADAYRPPELTKTAEEQQAAIAFTFEATRAIVALKGPGFLMDPPSMMPARPHGAATRVTAAEAIERMTRAATTYARTGRGP